MKNAKVFLAHADPDILGVVSAFLRRHHHEVVATASTVELAEEAICGVVLNEKQVTVAVIATNLSRESESDFEGRDGRKIVDTLAKLGSKVKTIAYYPVRQPHYGDLQVCQADSMRTLVYAIDRI